MQTNRRIGRPARGLISVGEGGEVVSRIADQEGRDIRQYLVVYEPADRRLTHRHLRETRRTSDALGRPALAIALDDAGTRLFRSLTEQNRPAPDGFARRLAILIDGEIHQAPSIREAISGGRGQITGVAPEAVADLAAAFAGGELDVVLIEERTP